MFTVRRLLAQSVRFYWRTHLGVILGVAVAALVLTGSLMVGDSVKATLRAQAEARVGKIGDVLVTGERFVGWPHEPAKRPDQVAHMFAPGNGGAGILLVQGAAARADSSARANRVQILGVDDSFWKLSPSGTVLPLKADEVILNQQLASQLGAIAGADVTFRLEKPGAFSKDAPLSGQENESILIRAKVQRIIGDADFGRFALTSGQVPTPSAFLPIAALQQKLGLGEKVNLITRKPDLLPTGTGSKNSFVAWVKSFFGGTASFSRATPILEALRQLDIRDQPEALHQFLTDLDLRVVELPNHLGFELRSPRIFLEAPIVAAARANEAEPKPPGSALPPPPPTPGLDSLTYFVNDLRVGDGTDSKAKATPYSMVTALDAPASGFVPAELADSEITITRWLADDLGIDVGGKVTLKYYVMGERRELIEKSRTFTVLGPILEMSEPQLNTSWMPDFPDVPDKDNFSKWKPGFPFESNRIRKKDEEYWKEHRGTPKAFVNLRVGQEMWGNRWGNLTSIRYPAGTTQAQVERIAAFIDPTALGFRIVPLREQALAATNAPVDFGQLFASFSFFLILAAAILTGLLFTFSIQQRAAEAGLLLATGWPQKKVRRLFLREGLWLALLGAILGAAGAAFFTQAVLHALASVWSGATGGTTFIFALQPATLAIGIVSALIIAYLAMWLASRKLFKRPAAALLSGSEASPNVLPAPVPKASSDRAARHLECGGSTPLSEGAAGRKTANRFMRFLASCFSLFMRALEALMLLLVIVPVIVITRGRYGSPILFFVFGFALLAAGLLLSRKLLLRASTRTDLDTAADLAARNTSRRRGRSLATISVLASGVFMVVAVDSFRKGPADDPTQKSSGTGGFTLIGESASPIYEDLNSEKGREAYGLDDQIMAGVHVVQLRVLEGDDASCLNLNRAVQPRLLGVQAAELAKLEAFRFSNDPKLGWAQLGGANPRSTELPSGRPAPVPRAAPPPVPGIVDANTLEWAMQKSLGDQIDYVDARGQKFPVQLVDALSGSMLQGMVIISEDRFVEKFPNAAGYRFFLIDCPPVKMPAVREHLSQQLADRGLELVPAAQRLADFNAVENTYLSIFQVLGGLGMLLGSAGLGIVVARNVLERRREFALLEALGFTPRELRRLVFAEHRWLILGALAIGLVSALIAVAPQLLQRGSAVPWLQLTGLFGGTAVIGIACAWFATRLSLRASQLNALRSE